MDSRTIFEHNLAELRKRTPDLADELEQASTAGIQERIGPRGTVVLCEGNVRLGSA